MALTKFNIEEGLSVGIEVHYTSSIPISNIHKILSITEGEVIRQCRSELENSLRELGVSDRNTLGRAKRLFRRYQSDLLVVNQIHQGSIIIEAAVTAVCTWVILNTVGESFKEAWKESEAHQNIKNILNRRLSFGLRSAGSRIQSKLKSKSGLKHSENIIQVESSQYPSIRVRVEYSPDENKYL